MEFSNKLALFGVFGLLLAGIIGGSVMIHESNDVSFDDSALAGVKPAGSEPIRFSNSICQTVTRADGRVEDLGCVHNAIVDLGRGTVRDALLGAARDISYIGFGNSTGAAAGDVAIAGELAVCGFSRAQGTKDYKNASAFTVYKTFTNSCDEAVTPNVTGLYNASSGNVLVFAGNITSPPTLAKNDQLTQNYTVNLA